MQSKIIAYIRSYIRQNPDKADINQPFIPVHHYLTEKIIHKKLALNPTSKMNKILGFFDKRDITTVIDLQKLVLHILNEIKKEHMQLNQVPDEEDDYLVTFLRKAATKTLKPATKKKKVRLAKLDRLVEDINNDDEILLGNENCFDNSSKTNCRRNNQILHNAIAEKSKLPFTNFLEPDFMGKENLSQPIKSINSPYQNITLKDVFDIIKSSLKRILTEENNRKWKDIHQQQKIQRKKPIVQSRISVAQLEKSVISQRATTCFKLKRRIVGSTSTKDSQFHQNKTEKMVERTGGILQTEPDELKQLEDHRISSPVVSEYQTATHFKMRCRYKMEPEIMRFGYNSNNFNKAQVRANSMLKQHYKHGKSSFKGFKRGYGKERHTICEQ